MKKELPRYLFLSLALSALLAPFAMHADDLGAQGTTAPAASQRPAETSGHLAAGHPRLRQWVARRALQRLDRDGDGRISAGEFQSPPRQDRFAAIDQDADGVISLEEMKRFQARRAEQRLERRFAALDADGDGKLTREEIRAQRFAHLDRDGDGYLSPRELFRARAPQPPPAE